MKKHLNLLILLGLCMIVKSTYSQKLYFNFGVGYNYSAANDYVFSERRNIVTTQNNINYLTGINHVINENVSFGKGLQYSAVVGFKYSDAISFEINLSQIKGNEYEDKLVESFDSYEDVYIQRFQSQMNRISPIFKIETGKGLFKPYLKVGLVFGFGTKIYVQEDLTYRENNVRVNYKNRFTYDGGLSIGYLGGLGLNIELSKRLGFFTELNIITQSWSPDKKTYTKIYKNDQNYMPHFSYSDINTEYVDSFENETILNNPNPPTYALKIYFPFSSIGWNTGIYFKL